jgi:hypothetical protein
MTKHSMTESEEMGIILGEATRAMEYMHMEEVSFVR